MISSHFSLQKCHGPSAPQSLDAPVTHFNMNFNQCDICHTLIFVTQ